ncbi:415_t:CDS:2, partial [Funneliformis geosporum]
LVGHPFLSSKVEYVEATTTLELCQRDLEVIDVKDSNTVGELKLKLNVLGKSMSGYSDAGFPIVDDSILVGYIASNELEHAINSLHSSDDTIRCYFKEPPLDLESIDFTAYTDQAPLTISKNASLEVVLEMFKKLGLRYLIVVNCGQYVGVIHKKRLLAYLRQMEGKKEGNIIRE